MTRKSDETYSLVMRGGLRRGSGATETMHGMKKGRALPTRRSPTSNAGSQGGVGGHQADGIPNPGRLARPVLAFVSGRQSPRSNARKPCLTLIIGGKA